jgi:anti-sigma B factor antagonist
MKTAMVIALSERTLVYRPSGPLDVATAAAVCDVLVRGAEPGRREVVLDLSGVTTFDAAGLGALVRAVRRVWRRGGSVRITDPRPHLATMLSLIGVDRIVPVELTGATPGGRAA